jgi:hypothetical protein
MIPSWTIPSVTHGGQLMDPSDDIHADLSNAGFDDFVRFCFFASTAV